MLFMRPCLFPSILDNGMLIKSSTVVLTAGTFLRGTITIGLDRQAAGRMGDRPTIGLAETLQDLGFTMGRLKTGS